MKIGQEFVNFYADKMLEYFTVKDFQDAVNFMRKYNVRNVIKSYSKAALFEAYYVINHEDDFDTYDLMLDYYGNKLSDLCISTMLYAAFKKAYGFDAKDFDT